MTEKKSYFVNMIVAKDGKMAEALNFNMCSHHDIAAMAERICQAGLFDKEKHAKQFVLAMHLMHHVIKKNPELELFREFGPQFEAFKKQIKESYGCGCEPDGCCK